MPTVLPSEKLMGVKEPKPRTTARTDEDIAAKYDQKTERIVTETNREKLQNFYEALNQPGYMDPRVFYQRRQVTLDLLSLHGRDHPNVAPKMPHDAMQLVKDFGSRSFWTRPFFSELVWRDGWSNSDPPVDPKSNLVFDPDLIVVSYIRAINMWLCTFALMEPTATPPELNIDMPTVLRNLHDYHEEHKAGIRMGPAPLPDDIAFVGVSHELPGVPIARRGDWTFAGEHIGAVDAYTNTQVLTQFSPTAAIFLEFDVPWEPEDRAVFLAGYPAFVVRFTLTGEARKKALYIAQGVGKMWETLQHLRRIAGTPRDLVNTASSFAHTSGHPDMRSLREAIRVATL